MDSPSKNRIRFFLGICTVFFMVISFGASADTELLAPTISVSPDSYYPLDEILFLEGRAGPLSMVQINFQQAGAKPLSFNVVSNASGEWALAEKVPLDGGNWQIETRAVLPSGAVSVWSNPRVIKVIVTGVVIGGFVIKYAPVVTVIALCFLAAFSLLMYAVYRMRLVTRIEKERDLYQKTAGLEKTLLEREKQVEEEKRLHREVDTLKESLHEKEREAAKLAIGNKFFELRRTMLDEVEHLEKKSGEHEGMTKEEEGQREHLLHELREAEEELEKSIK